MTQALPGAPPWRPELQARLERMLAEHPQTSATGSRWTNRLLLESSPYLLQHAHNPVDWHPWGDEAFAEARARGVPVFLSVGYSTCHWCHVMEAESFEDEEIAELLNREYVPVKVDREERPDVDAIYMSAVQQLAGRGGWPMSVWLTPERQPFFAGTYFPARDGERGAPTGFLTLLGELSSLYRDQPERVQRAADALTQAVREEIEGQGRGGPVGVPGYEAVARTVAQVGRLFDPMFGGLRGPMKFPYALPIRLLLRQHRRTGDMHALHMAVLTLESMAAGGIHDQLGGGFHRYATDERWLVPHFEKMLYDNALLAVAYLEAHQVTGRDDLARVARSVLDYLLRDMMTAEGGFASATDADSEGTEGRYFVWTPAELTAVLGAKDAERFSRYYGVTAGGNFEGTNVLHVPRVDDAEHLALAPAREKLLQARSARVPPARDDKIITAWNGLAISALATAARVLDEPRYLEAAIRAADLLLGPMRLGGRIVHSFRAGRHGPPAFLEDFAFLVAALLDLHESSLDARWLEEALALAVSQETELADVENGGWFAAPDAPGLIAREKPGHDGAYPSGTSVALLNALRIGALTDDDRWRLIAETGFASVHEVIATRPLAMAEALLAVDFAAGPPRQVAIAWPHGRRADALDLLTVVWTTFAPDKVLAGGEEGHLDAVARIAGFVQGKEAIEGRPAAYVCRQGACELPTTDPETLRRSLAPMRFAAEQDEPTAPG